MRAVVVREAGGVEVMHLDEVAAPVPVPGEVRVRVHAFGVNRGDILQRRGQYPAPPGAPADILGLEYAGEVELVGPGVSGFSAKDRVMGIAGGGTYAELVVVPAEHLLPIPAQLSMEQAAAIPEVFVTAFDALERAALTRDEWCLVHAVGSGVGTAVLQLAKARGARVIGTSRSAAKLERARALGLDAAIDTSVEPDFVAAVRRVCGDGVQVAIDLIGGPRFPSTLAALALRGRAVLLGLTAGARAEVDLTVVLRRRLKVEGTVLRSRTRSEKADVTRAFGASVLPLFEQGMVHPVIDRVYSLEEVREAHRRVEADENFGKVVVRVGSSG